MISSYDDVANNHYRHYQDIKITDSQVYRAEYLINQMNATLSACSPFENVGNLAEYIHILVLIKNKDDETLRDLGLNPDDNLKIMARIVKVLRRELI